MKINRNGLKAAILTMSFLQMATNAVSSILAEIAASFPDASTSSVQYLMTFPNLLVVVMSIVTARLTVIISKRKLAATGLLLGAAAGLLSFLFHSNIILLYIWAGMLGIGIGLVIPVANGLIAAYFEGGEKDALLGLQTSSANVGSMLMTFFGGLLALLGWHYTYFVYLLAVPGLICVLLFVPEDKKREEQTKEGAGSSAKIPAFAIPYFIFAILFMLLFYVGPTNVAMLVQERGTGSSVTAGTAATVLLLGGAIVGLVFGKIAAKIGKLTISAGFLMMVIGYLGAYFIPTVPALMVSSFLIGTSNTLVLPQCMGSVVTENKEQSTLLMAITLACANLGTFFAPALTAASALATGSTTAASRFLFTGVASAVLMVITAVFATRQNRRLN